MNRNGNSQNAAYLDNALRKKRGKIEEMATVMRHAVDVDEGSDERSEDAVARLTRENEILRKTLRICENQAAAEAAPAAETAADAEEEVKEVVEAQEPMEVET